MSQDRPDTSAGKRVGQIALALIASQALFRAWAMNVGYFLQDDFFLMWKASRSSLSFDYIFQDYNGHISPGGFLFIWVTDRIAPMNFGVATGTMVVLQLIASWTVWLLIREFVGARPGALIALAVYLFSPMTLSSFLWYSAGLTSVVLQLVMAATVFFHVRHLRTGRGVDAVWALVVFALGVLWSEKALLVLPVVAVVTLIWFGTGGLLRRIAQVLREHHWLWLAYSTISVGFVALYVWRVAWQLNSDVKSSTLDLANEVVTYSFLPTLFGGPYTIVPGGIGLGADLSMSTRILFAELFVIVVIATLVSNRRAWRGWLLLIGYLAINILLLAKGRGDAIGPILGRDTRYIADVSVIAALAIAVAICPPRARSDSGLFEPSVKSDEAPVTTKRWHVAAMADRPLAVGLVLFAYLNSCLFTSIPMVEGWEAGSTEPYVENARRDLQLLGDVVIYDTIPPPDILHPWFLGDALVSRVLSQFPEGPRFDEPADQLYVVDATGHVLPAVFLPAVGSSSGPEACGWPIGPAPSKIPIEPTLFAGRWTIRVDYAAKRASVGTIIVGDRRYEVEFAAGSHQLFVVYVGEIDSIAVEQAATTTDLCVSQVVVGQI